MFIACMRIFFLNLRLLFRAVLGSQLERMVQRFPHIPSAPTHAQPPCYQPSPLDGTFVTIDELKLTHHPNL